MINQNNVPLEVPQTIQQDMAGLSAEKLNEPHGVANVERLSDNELYTLRKIALDRGRELQIRLKLRGLA